MTPRLTHRLQIVGAALLFSTGGAAIKATTMNAWQVAGFRSAIAAVALLLLLPGARRGWSWRIVPVALAYAATLVLFVTANKLTTAANTIFLQSTAPLYILLLGPWLLDEPIRKEDLLFMAVIATGFAFFFVGNEAPVRTAPDPLRGNLLATLSGVCWALTVVGLRWVGRSAGVGKEAAADGSAELSTVALGNLLAFLITLPLALPVRGAGAGDWAVIAYLGVFQIGLAYVLLTRAIRHLRALEASILLLVEPALNPVWAWLAHGERPGPWSLTGGALVLSATLLKTARDARAATASGAAAS